jgi:hypothetical protein
MFRRKQSGDDIEAEISGPVQGQVAIGREIAQRQSTGTMNAGPTPDERLELQQAIVALRAQVAKLAPPEQRAQALERIDELDEAISAGKPDVTTMRYVRGWFAKHLPGLAGAVVSVVIHPVVGKLVEAAGDAAVAQFQQLVDDT